MRTLIINGELEVDLISTPDELARVIKLGLAAGLTVFRGEPGEEGFLRVLFSASGEAWAEQGYAALLAVAATINGNDVQKVIEQFVNERHALAKEMESFRKP